MRIKFWRLLLKYWRQNSALNDEMSAMIKKLDSQRRYIDALCDGLAYRDNQVRFLAEIAGNRLRRMHHRSCDCPICVKLNGLEPLIGIIKGRESNVCLLRGEKQNGI